MTLKDYLARHGTDTVALAAALGVTRATVDRWRDGRHYPRRDAMVRLVRVTGGEVGPADFYDLSPAGEACSGCR